MKKIYLFSLLIIISGSLVKAQSSAKVIYAEIGGPGFASLNYDMRFANKEDGLGFRAGVGGFTIDNTSMVFFPMGLNYITSKDQKNYFELGLGITPVSVTNGGSSSHLSTTFGHMNIGYRLQPKAGGFFFRAGITPIFGSGFFFPYYAGLSFGYKF